MGVYALTVAKYSLYVFTGIVGVAACVIARKALAANKPLGLSMLVVALAIVSRAVAMDRGQAAAGCEASGPMLGAQLGSDGN